MQIKICTKTDHKPMAEFENKINNFIGGMDIVDIKTTSTMVGHNDRLYTGLTVMVLYK